MNSGGLTLLHIEDDPVWSDVVAGLLRTRGGVEHLGTFASVDAAVGGCRSTPRLILANARPRAGCGFAALATFRAHQPGVRIALLTDRCDELTLFHARRGWISGALWKPTFSPAKLALLIDRVARDERYFADEFREGMSALGASPVAFFKILSDVEIALLPRFARGESDREIAGVAGASPLTIKTHRHRIMTKLDVHKSEKLMRWCIDKGFMELP
jgi:two-component system nitrate/nitrite response regulator NarL